MAENTEKELMGLDNVQSEECGSKESAVETSGIITLHDQDSENLAGDTMAVLKKKDEDIRKIKDLLTISMKSWVHDLIRRVELVKGEVKSARNMVLPTCIIIDELEEKGEKHDELAELVNTIMGNVECVVKQIPVATNVIGLIMDHLRHLPQTGEKADSTLEERLEKEKVPKAVLASTVETEKSRNKLDSLDSAVPRSDVSSGDLKSEQDSVESLPESQELQTSAPDILPEKKKSAKEPPLQTKEDKSGRETKLDSESPENISSHMISTLKGKVAEMECTSMVIGDVMKYWITDVLEKIDYVTQEVSLARKLVNNTNDKIQSLSYTLPRESEIKDLMHTLFEKVEDLVKQTSAVTTLVGNAVEEMMYMRGMVDFREELCATVLVDIPKNLDEVNPSRDEAESENEEKIAGNIATDKACLSKEFPKSADESILPTKNSHKKIMPRTTNNSPQKKNLSEKTPEKKNGTNSRKSPKKDKNSAYKFTVDKKDSNSGDKNGSLDSASVVCKDELPDSTSVDNNESADTIEKLRGASSESESDLSCESCDTYFFEEEAFEVSMTNFAILDLIEPVTLRNYRRFSDCE